MTDDTRRARFGRREVQRIEALYERVPGIVVSSLLGVLLVFIFLAPITSFDLLKAWAAYQLTTLALRGWLWHLFRTASVEPESVARWEWLFAGGSFLTGLGWAMLCGPLFPQGNPSAQTFVLLMTFMAALAGTVFVSLSLRSALIFLIPTLIPPVILYARKATSLIDGPMLAVVASIFVILSTLRSVRQFALRQLDHASDLEELVGEQNTIFQAAPLGIAVLDGERILKANTRLSSLFGYRHSDFMGHPVSRHFCDANEAARFDADARETLRAGQSFQGIYRMQRADGSQFWAEMSGQPVADTTSRSVWLIADVTLRATQQERH